MMRVAWVLVVLFAACAAVAGQEARDVKAEPAPKPDGNAERDEGDEGEAATEIRLLALQVCNPPEDDEEAQWAPGPVGVWMTLRCVRKDKFIIDVDREASRIILFTDDRNTNLVKPRKGLLRRLVEGEDDEEKCVSDAAVSEDGHRCEFQIGSPLVPARGATRLMLDARVVLLCGKDLKTAEQKDFSLEPGKEATLGPFTVRPAGPDEHIGEAAAGVNISWRETREKKEKGLQSVTFIDPDGEEIQSRLYGTEASRADRLGTYTHRYVLEREAKKITVRLTYFDEIERLVVPVTVNTGVGF